MSCGLSRRLAQTAKPATFKDTLAKVVPLFLQAKTLPFLNGRGFMRAAFQACAQTAALNMRRREAGDRILGVALNAIKNGYPIKVLPGDYAFREPLVVVTDKGDPEWTAKIGEIVKVMKDDGTLSRLTTKWYGKDYSG